MLVRRRFLGRLNELRSLLMHLHIHFIQKSIAGNGNIWGNTGSRIIIDYDVAFQVATRVKSPLACLIKVCS